MSADETPLTTEPVPGETLTTEPVPEPSSPDGMPSEPQPTLEQLQAERDQWRNKARGSADEWRREKAERERLEAQLRNIAQVQPQAPPPPPQEPPHRRFAGRLNKAILEGDENATGEILRDFEDQITQRNQQQTQQFIGQVAVEGQRQQSWTNYLNRLGVPLDQNNPTYIKVAAKVESMKTDPLYMWGNHDPRYLWSVAALEVKAENANQAGAMKATARATSAMGAQTEPSARTGLPPGKTPPKEETVYLTQDEQKGVNILQSSLKCSRAEAEKSYWNQLPAAIREARTQQRRAF